MSAAATTLTEEQGEPNEADVMAMVEEIGTAVAAGLVPFLGQAINVYDTIESLLTLHNSQGEAAASEAKFDLVLALVGWIPGAGGGVKKTIRIVNKNPARYAPILFDVLRMVCVKLGIQTSPESLLDKLFDAAGLKAILGTVQSGVEKSWAYDQLPSEAQQVLSATMATVRASLPSMLMLVTMKLAHWKRLQRNTAARSTGTRMRDASARKPAAKHPSTATKGTNTPANVSGNTATNSVVGTAPLSTVTNEIIGMLGEHITDYFLYEEYGWGKSWNSHDRGIDGAWKAKPGKDIAGKLNEGTKLNPLLAVKAHGIGIDGVWRVDHGDLHNGGKPYAVVESKASASRKAPANHLKKPSIIGKLSTNARRLKKAAAKAAEAALPKIEDLLDPAEIDAGIGTSQRSSGRKTGGTSRNQSNARKPQSSPVEPAKKVVADILPEGAKVIVQMSQDWIEKNIGMAVKDPEVLRDFRRFGLRVYSRHLFYTPFYLPTAAQHLLALQAEAGSAGAAHSNHDMHSLPPTHCHNESEVKAAVNSKLKRLNLAQES